MLLLGGRTPPEPLLFLGVFQPPRPPGGGPAAHRATSLDVSEAPPLKLAIFFGGKNAPKCFEKMSKKNPRPLPRV